MKGQPGVGGGTRGKRGQGDQEVRKHSVSQQHADPGGHLVFLFLTYPSSPAVMLGNRKTAPARVGRAASTFTPPLTPKNKTHKCEQPGAAALTSPHFNYSAESMSSGHVKALLTRCGGGISRRASTERPLRQDAAGLRRGGGTVGWRQGRS